MSLAGIVRPTDPDELRDVVAQAVGASVSLEARSGGSKRDIGSCARETVLVDLAAFSGVVDYEPSELVLTVKPATPLGEVQDLLARNGQMLAFEPIDHGPLFGRAEGQATIGGAVAAGVAGSRRISAGGARDHLLGFQGVSGRAEIFRGGGKVVKNVTGYDISKVIAGSWGQLAIVTELSVKVVPRPKMTQTLSLWGLEAVQAVAAMARAMGSSCFVSAAAHVPARAEGKATTAFRLEGFSESVEARSLHLSEELSPFGPAAVLSEGEASALWRNVSHAELIASHQDLWRVNLIPSRAADFVCAIDSRGGKWLLDWAGAVAWVSTSAEFDIHGIAAQFGGHAMLIRRSLDARSLTPVRRPGSPGLVGLSARLKSAFDPAGILDPHRFG